MPRGGIREGAGRKKEGKSTHTIRVNTDISREDAEIIPELKRLVADWEADCLANPGSARRYYLKKAVDQLRALGL